MTIRSAAPLLCALFAACAVAGPLDPPPGPVEPTMKTLSEVEPRTPIDSLPFVISASGSYYLTRSLVGPPDEVGILVRARRVVIDLNGFELRGAAGSLHGIHAIPGVAPCSELTVRNGAIVGWGESGVNAECVAGSVFERLRLEGNAGAGIRAGNLATVLECAARDCGDAGIALGDFARVEGATLDDNGSDGLSTGESAVVLRVSASRNRRIGLNLGARSIASECVVSNNTAVGVRAEAGSILTRIVANENGNIGIALNGRGLVAESTAVGNIPTGILAFPGARVERCVVSESSANGLVLNGPAFAIGNTLVDNPTGILLNNTGSRIDGNDVSGGTTGIHASAGANTIVRNTVRGAGTPFNLAPGNLAGPVETSISDHPWANFVQE